ELAFHWGICVHCTINAILLTEALAHPDAHHVQLEQRVVDVLALLDVHEQMVDEASAPGGHRSEDVTERQKLVATVPGHQSRHNRKDVEDGTKPICGQMLG
ncbi:hypothetical protein M5D96_000704, partial [Drosophila gunungcola]